MKPTSKSTRITIHQSGRVNYHENGRSIFIAPLTQTTQIFPIYGYRVPALEMLDMHDKDVSEDDVIFDLSDTTIEPISFSILIGPGDFMPQANAIRLGYEVEGYSITVQVDHPTVAVPVELNEYFTSFIPDEGLFLEQQMAEDQAMILYHQALNRTFGAILYSPNGEGIIRMIFAVPMRIAPQFKIELADSELYVSDQDIQRDPRSENVMLKFKVRDQKTKMIIRKVVEIKSIVLDAEL